MEEPDRDNCDRCGKFAWNGMPVWTCALQLYCEDCSNYINNEREKHEEKVWMETFFKSHLN